MSLRIVCHYCKRALRLKRDVRGEKIKCPACGQSQVVPLPPEIMTLLEQLQDKNLDNRVAATEELGGAFVCAPEIVRALIRTLANAAKANHDGLVFRAIRALGYKGSEAIRAAGKFSSDASAAIPALVEALAFRDQDTRKAVLAALEAIDPRWRSTSHAPEAIPRLAIELFDSKPAREAAQFALQAIDPNWRKGSQVPAVLSALVRNILIKTTNLTEKKQHRDAVVHELDLLDPDWRTSRDAQEFLAALLHGPRPGESEYDVVVGLHVFGKMAQPAVAKLRDWERGLRNTEHGHHLRNEILNLLDVIEGSRR